MQLLFSFGGQRGTVVLQTTGSMTVGEALAAAASKALLPGSTAELIALHQGRQLSPSSLLAQTSLQPNSTITITSRLLGGGGDGGSTGAESRSCYLEMYASKKPDKVNPAEAKLAKWTCCHLSGETLNPPCVIDDLGTLFNKDALVSALLHKTMPSGLAHISSLKHVTELKLTRNSSQPSSSKKVAQQQLGYEPAIEAQFACPITGAELNGRHRFVVHKPTGHVLSEAAIKKVPAAVSELLGDGWSKSDLMPVNPQEEEVALLKERLLEKLTAEREKKRNKKAAKAAANGTAAAAAAAGVAATGDKKRGLEEGPAAAAAAGASKKLRVPDGATSDVYASLFTSSLKEKPKETFLCRAI